MRLLRDIGKGSVAIVPQQVIVRAQARRLRHSRCSINQEDILKTIVVVIQEARAQSVNVHKVFGGLVPVDQLHLDAGLLSDIGENRQGNTAGGLFRRIHDGSCHGQEP